MNENRKSPIKISEEEFKAIGYSLIDRIANFNSTIEGRKVTKGETPEEMQDKLGTISLPEKGVSTKDLVSKASDLLMNHSLLNGHPKFMGYISGSAAPIAALSDLLSATVNPNTGAYILSPMATEIERQTIQWLAEFIGLPSSYGGILVSGGNMANFTAFLAARTAKSPKEFKKVGFLNSKEQLVMYCSKATHTWIEKAAILFGHGTDSIRWIDTDTSNKMNINDLEATIKADLKAGHKPFMVAGTAGDVSTGTVDNLEAIASVCKANDLWFHIDGAYGAPAAIIPELKSMFKGIEEADSIAIDPHKWLYSSLEAGCTLVKNPKHLLDTYSSHPEYYNFSNEHAELNFYEYGLQNSRGLRGLKVWLMIQQVGRQGYESMISEDIELSKLLFELANKHPELNATTQNLSITTFRYVPEDIPVEIKDKESYLNKLNEDLVNHLQKDGQVFLSNAIIDEKYCLRSCIVNFRTTKKDIQEIIKIVVTEGRKIHDFLKTNFN